MKELYNNEMIKKWPDFAKMLLRWVSVPLHHLSLLLTLYMYLNKASNFNYSKIY